MTDQIGEHKIHPAAAAFPLIEGAEFSTLVESVRASGLREPIVFVTGKDSSDRWIVDGRNRLRALIELGIKPVASHFKFYRGDDVETYVIDKNINRRHLAEAQRAMIAASLATLRRGTKKSDVPIGSSATSLDDAAKKMNVGRTSVSRAKRVKDDGVPEVVRAVMAGDLSLYAAERIAALPKEAQANEVAAARDMKAIKRKALALLAAGMRPHDVASSVGVDGGTISRWSANPNASTKDSGVSRPRAVPDSEITRLFNAGHSVTEMVKLTGACKTTISQSLKRLGLSRAGQRTADQLGEHTSRIEISAETIEASTSLILAVASVSTEEQTGDLIAALNRLSRAVSNLKTRLNKEAGKKEGNGNG